MTYLFAVGSGADAINESAYDGIDKIVFTGLNKADVTFQKLNIYDLKISINSTGESVYIQHEYDTAYVIESFVFNDSILTQGQGTNGDDILYGLTSANNILYGLAGNDILIGGYGNDSL